MSKQPYEFKEVTANLFEQTKAAWVKALHDNANDASESLYGGCFSYCRKQIDGEMETGDAKGAIYGVFRQGEGDVACALLSLIHQQTASGKLKVASLYVEPNLNLASSAPNPIDLAIIAATAIVGCLELTYQKFKATELKIWANVPMDKEFLTAVATALKLHNHFTVTSHGNWLVVNKS